MRLCKYKMAQILQLQRNRELGLRRLHDRQKRWSLEKKNVKSRMGAVCSALDCCISDEEKIRKYEARIRKEKAETQLLNGECEQIKTELDKHDDKRQQISKLEREKQKIFRAMLKEKQKSGNLENEAEIYKQKVNKMEEELLICRDDLLLDALCVSTDRNREFVDN